MTKITFFKTGDHYYGFEEIGHTGYGEAGDDVLCAALSSMTMLIINAIEVVYASAVDYIIDDKTADIKLIARCAVPRFSDDEKNQYAISGLIKAYYYQLMDLTEEYYDYLEVNTVDLDPEDA